MVLRRWSDEHATRPFTSQVPPVPVIVIDEVDTLNTIVAAVALVEDATVNMLPVLLMYCPSDIGAWIVSIEPGVELPMPMKPLSCMLKSDVAAELATTNALVVVEVSAPTTERRAHGVVEAIPKLPLVVKRAFSVLLVAKMSGEALLVPIPITPEPLLLPRMNVDPATALLKIVPTALVP